MVSSDPIVGKVAVMIGSREPIGGGTAFREPMKVFTVEEANALIPKLQTIFAEMQNLRKGMAVLDPLVRPAREKATEGGGAPHGALFVRVVQRLSKILQEVDVMGVLIKDLEAGLFDFPHRLDDRIVLLCWKHGEAEIDWYHDVDTGFSGRKPFPKERDPIV